jgi:DNA-binding CsgD family transcriptional regulator
VFALIEGEAGIGKSAVLKDTLASAQARGLVVRTAAADELDRRCPFALIEAALGPVEVPAPTAGVAGLGRPHVEADVAGTVVDRAVALATHQPFVLALEDLQWADPASLAVLGRLARRLRDVPILVVATARRAPRSTPLARLLAEAVPDQHRLLLGAMPEEEVAALVAVTVDGVPSHGLLAQLAGATGNPLLVLELIAALDRAKALTRADGVVDAESVALPDGFAAAVASRLLEVPSDVRELLRVAAVLGRSFRVTDLAHVMGRPIAQLVRRLEAAQAAGLIEPHERGLSFRHDLIRAALIEELAPSLVRALHLDVAHALAEAGASSGRVAEHLARGAEPGNRDAVARLAGFARTLGATSPDDAAELLELAMTLAGSADPVWPSLACDRAVTLLWAGRAVEAEQTAAASLLAGAQGQTAARAVLTRAHALQGLGRLGEALEVAEEGVRSPWRAARPHAAAAAAFSRLYLGDRQQAISEAEGARRDAANVGDAVAGCYALQVLVLGYGMSGQFARAVELAEVAARLADSEPGRAGHRFAGHVMLSGFLVHLDRLDDADRAIAEGRFLVEQLGDRQVHAYLALARAVVCFANGDWAAADTELDVGLSAVRGMGAGWLLAPLGLQGLLAVHRGDLAAARRAVTATHAARVAGGAAPFTEFAVLAAARLHEAEDRPDLALSALAEAWDAATARGSAAEYPALAVDLARLAVAAGDETLAWDATTRLEELAAANPGVPTLQGRALRCRGLVEHDVGALLAAVEAHRAGPRPLERGLACGEAAVALAQRGDRASAVTLLDEARLTLSALGARHDLVRTVSAARQAGLRPGRRPGERPAYGVAALTPAERVVAELVAEGLTNPEIGDRLFVSRNTVRTHVSRALSKLKCRSRSELAATMMRTGPADADG